MNFVPFIMAMMLAAPSPQAVVAAEHDFAKAVATTGFKRGFLAFAAPDAIIFAPGPVNARADLQKQPDDGPTDPPLDWWPDFAGIARSGDFGFTTGPASIPVRYFTVWKKQPDGNWKWIYDGGPGMKDMMPGGAATKAVLLPASTAAAGSADKALAEIAPLEARIATASATDARSAPTAFLAAEALVAGSPLPSYAGNDQTAALARRPATLALRPIGGSASAAGDMAFTYGEARWTNAEQQPRWGHYTRIWQKRREGWKLVVDMLIGAPGAPPPGNSS